MNTVRNFSYAWLLLLVGCASQFNDLPLKGKIDATLQQTDMEIIAIARTLKELKTIGVIEPGSALDNEVRDKLLEANSVMNEAWGYYEQGLFDLAIDKHRLTRTILIELRKIARERQ